MIVIMKPKATPEHTAGVIAEVERCGFASHPIYGEHLTVVAVVGGHPGDLIGHFESLPGVDRVVLIDQSYKLVARAGRPSLGFTVGDDLTIGGGAPLTVIAGPCSVESEGQVMACARIAAECGATMLRGGAFKPRTSPYSFQGLGEEGLKLMAAARAETGLQVVSEVTDPRLCEVAARYVDMIQIGARNMQNFALLSEAGATGLPVMLKRGLAASIDDWLNAAEYVASTGNERVLLCERGIRTYETATRNTLDIACVPVLRKLTHLPICLDPSHAAGVREYIPPLMMACAAVGADAIMIEIHPEPGLALSDGAQSLDFPLFQNVMRQLRAVPRYDYAEAAANGAPRGS
jgi:3-deoxy-7-phosphoheptulonate synthase